MATATARRGGHGRGRERDDRHRRQERTHRGAPAATLALVLVAILAVGCGELTTRTWITIDEEASGGYVEFALPNQPPAELEIVRLQGGFLVEVTLDTADLPGPMHGDIVLRDVRIAGEVEDIIGNLCTFGDPNGVSGGPLVIDVLGGTADSSMFLDAYATTEISDLLGVGPIPFEQDIDFDIGSAFDMVTFFNAFLTGSADGLFNVESTIASNMSLLGIDAVFAMNAVVTNGGQPPVFDADLLDYCAPRFAGQGVGTSHVEILNVKSSYLRRAGNDQPKDPVVIPLAELGALPGDVLQLSTVGTYSGVLTLSDGSATELGAVFSSSDEVLPASELFRVPGAIDAGVDVVTWPSIVCFLGICEDRGGDDIPQDFRVDPQVGVTVPPGANYLIVAPIDPLRLYGDNTGLGFGIRIDVFPQ